MANNGLKSYNRLVYEAKPLLGTNTSPATLSSSGTTVHVNGMLGFSAIVLFVRYIRNGGAATSIDVTGTTQHPGLQSGGSPVDCALTSDVFDSTGVGTRAKYTDSYAVPNSDDAYEAVIPVTAGDNVSLTFKAPGATTDQVVVYFARAS